ncbi:MAG: hypothetical protein IK027_03790 [Deltaproteobacteria bacterium]|nr:hypothetical protein [Deltaproteobacteria bacterium]
MFNLYEVIIRPDSLFGTPLAGDTLFGHLCWQFALDESLLSAPFADCTARYAETPFLVVSSAVPRIRLNNADGYALPCPDLTIFTDSGSTTMSLPEKLENRKTMKKNKWFFVGSDLRPVFDVHLLLNGDKVAAGIQALDGASYARTATTVFTMQTERSHNSINRLTGTTGEGAFAPYSTEAFSFLPGTTLAVFVLADTESCPADKLRTVFERVGLSGYGRDASTGLGRFSVLDVVPRALPKPEQTNAWYTLAPCVPPKTPAGRTWAKPITRFGKHGGAPENRPFKAPVVMADTGAVFQLGTPPENNVFGCGITGVSKARPETIIQGYAPVLPCTVKEA